jgi:hypothetical protein
MSRNGDRTDRDAKERVEDKPGSQIGSSRDRPSLPIVVKIYA